MPHHPPRVRRLVGATVLATLTSGTTLLTAPTSVAAAPPSSAVDAPGGLTASGSVGAGYPVLSWVPVPGATSYEIEVDDDPAFGTPSTSATTVNVSYVATTALPAGTQSWRVRSLASGVQSAWSSSTVDVPRTATPQPIAPESDTVLDQPDEPALLEWSVVPGTTSYVVQVDDEPGFVQPVEYTTKATSLVVPDPLAPVQDWFWRVKAIRGTGIESAYSAHRSFRIGALAVPEVVSPDSSPDNDLTDVVLDWRPVPGARYYDLEVSTDDDFATSTIVDSRTRLTGTRYSPAVTYDNNQYFWRVRAVSSDAAVKSAWSPSTNQFRRSWPDRPTLVYPEADATAVGDPFFYEWTPVPHATWYELQISSSPLFDANVSLCLTAGTTFTPNAYQLTDPLAGGRSKDSTRCAPFEDKATYWRVRALDRHPSSSRVVQGLLSESRSFTYAKSPAPAGEFGPVVGQRVALTGTGTQSETACTGAYADGVPVFPTCADLPSTPVFAWEPVPNAASYVVYVSNDDKFTNLLEYAATTSTMWTPSTNALHPAIPESQAGASYFWFVRPCLKADSCSGSASPISVTPSMATNVFRKRSPGITGGVAEQGTGDGTEVTFSWDDYACTNAGLTPAYASTPCPAADGTTWNGSGPESTSHQTAQAYRVEVSATASFATLLDFAVVDQTTYTAPAKLYPDGPLHWRVRAIDAADNDLAWSPTWTWSKTGPAVSLASPADATEISASVPLQWEARAHAWKYEVQVAAADDPTFSSDHVLFTASTTQTAYTWDKVVPASALPYVWRVRRVDSVGNLGAWSAVRRFSNPRVDPVLQTPAAGANVAAARTLFTWDFVPGATSYKLEVTQGTRTTTWTTTGNAYAPTTAFSAGERQWRVVALDAARDEIGASSPQSFRVEALAPVTSAGVQGTGKVGTDLAATAPIFDPAAESLTYQWFRGATTTATPTAGATAIDGATGPVHTVTATDLGSYLLVRVTGTRDGYPAGTSDSAPTLAVLGDAPVPTARPTLGGDPRVGEQLTAAPGTWSPTPSARSYQWLRDGTPIAGATSATYRLVAADLAHEVAVRETATLPGRSPGTATSDPVTATTGSAPVATVAPQLVAPPAVTAGDTVTVRTGTWSPSAGLAFTYRWLRDGAVIDGATGSTYQLTTSDVGRSVGAVVTATAAGREPGEASTGTVVPNGAVTATAPPTITGEPISGRTLTATSGAWTGSVQVRYHWFVDGVAAGEPSTSATYVLRSADIGRAVRVRVLATATGYLPGSADSAPLTIRSEGPITNLGAPAITGTATPGSTLRVSSGTWSTDATFAYQWFREGAAIPGATSASYAVTGADAGRKVAVVVTASAEHWEATTKASNVVTVAKAPSTTALSLSAARTTTRRQVTATITIRSAGATTPGTVTVLDGTRRLTTLRLTGARATYRLPRLSAGTHTIKVVYSGTTQVAGSTRTARLVVKRG